MRDEIPGLAWPGLTTPDTDEHIVGCSETRILNREDEICGRERIDPDKALLSMPRLGSLFRSKGRATSHRVQPVEHVRNDTARLPSIKTVAFHIIDVYTRAVYRCVCE
jgi:hypothetical protein